MLVLVNLQLQFSRSVSEYLRPLFPSSYPLSKGLKTSESRSIANRDPLSEASLNIERQTASPAVFSVALLEAPVTAIAASIM